MLTSLIELSTKPNYSKYIKPNYIVTKDVKPIQKVICIVDYPIIPNNKSHDKETDTIATRILYSYTSKALV